MATVFRSPIYAPRPADAPVWLGQPVDSAAIQILTQQPVFGAGGEVPAKFWRYDYLIDAPLWLGVPIAQPSMLVALTAGGEPFNRQWRYDLFEPPPWNWPAPPSSPIRLLTEGGQPRTKTWRLDLAPDTVWVWTPSGVTLASLLPSEPFSRFWRPDGDHAAAFWQWLGQRNSALTLPTASSSPFSNPWQPANIDGPVWAWLPLLSLLMFPIPRADPRFGTIAGLRKSGAAARVRALGVPAPLREVGNIARWPVPQVADFSQMDVGETVNGWIDFAQWLAPSETISAVSSVAAANYYPTGGSNYVNITGSASVGTVPVSEGGSGVANAAVLQQWTGVAVGVARITITVTTSAGQTLTAWGHQPVGQPN